VKNKYGVGPEAMEHTCEIMVQEVQRLGAQRDALLAACKEVRSRLDALGPLELADLAVAILDDAIAKAEEQ
jgi:hypothetical protein